MGLHWNLMRHISTFLSCAKIARKLYGQVSRVCLKLLGKVAIFSVSLQSIWMESSIDCVRVAKMTFWQPNLRYCIKQRDALEFDFKFCHYSRLPLWILMLFNVCRWSIIKAYNRQIWFGTSSFCVYAQLKGIIWLGSFFSTGNTRIWWQKITTLDRVGNSLSTLGIQTRIEICMPP